MNTASGEYLYTTVDIPKQSETESYPSMYPCTETEYIHICVWMYVCIYIYIYTYKTCMKTDGWNMHVFNASHTTWVLEKEVPDDKDY